MEFENILIDFINNENYYKLEDDNFFDCKYCEYYYEGEENEKCFIHYKFYCATCMNKYVYCNCKDESKCKIIYKKRKCKNCNNKINDCVCNEIEIVF